MSAAPKLATVPTPRSVTHEDLTGGHKAAHERMAELRWSLYVLRTTPTTEERMHEYVHACDALTCLEAEVDNLLARGEDAIGYSVDESEAAP